MNRKFFVAIAAGSLVVFAARAQTPPTPAAEAKPEASQQKDAAAPAPGPGQEPDPEILGGMMRCMAEGLPATWKKAWFVVSEIGRETDADGVRRRLEATFHFATDPNDMKGKPFKPCGTNRIVDGVIALNDYLQPSQKHWTGVTMTFTADGSYKADYDFTARKPAPAKAATKPTAKKKQETAK